MAKVRRGDKLVMVTNKGRRIYCYFYKRDKEDPLGWILVVFKATRHVARVSPKWVRKVV